MTIRHSEADRVVDEVIAYIHQQIWEPITLHRLARYAGYSPFHFTRIFKNRTGLTPLYYVSSVRLQRAKDLLLHTRLTVRDIALEIGHQSLGTFTTRFTERVGVTPAQFRKTASMAEVSLRLLKQFEKWPGPPSVSDRSAVVRGSVRLEIPFGGVILIGLFAKPIPEGLPLYGTLMSSSGEFCFAGVKPGTYYLMATSVSWGMQVKDILIPETTLRYRSKEPIIVGPRSFVPYQQVLLRPPLPDDPPILISLPLLMANFLNRFQKNAPG